MSSYDLIIFDCDGTLVGSEYLNNKVCGDLLRNFGLAEYTTEKCIIEFSGKSWTEIRQILNTRHECEIPQSLIEEYIAGVNRERADLLEPIDGALECVQKCAEKTKVAVGSNGQRGNVIQSLEMLGFLDIFTEETIFTRIQVQNPKPHPELFFLAAKEMDAEPAKCLVIEDSPTGVLAGVAAGMEVWGFIGTAYDPKSQEKALIDAGATRIFDDFIHITSALSL